jgi:hypothetical protein
MTSAQPRSSLRPSLDWELDFYSRPILEADGRKRWELLICSSPDPSGRPTDPLGAPSDPLLSPPSASAAPEACFRWQLTCPAESVNSIWLRQGIEAALAAAAEQGWARPRRLRCWRGSMRTMVQRAAEGLGLELVPSRRCYQLVEWLQQRQRDVYPLEPGYLAGPLAPPPQPIRPVAVPLPEAVRGHSWDWATLPVAALREACEWEIGFSGLMPLPRHLAADTPVPGIRLFGRARALAIAGWLAGLEPVRLEIEANRLVLEAGLEDRWLLANLTADEAEAAALAFAAARDQAAGMQFITVLSDPSAERLEGFWLLRDLADG